VPYHPLQDTLASTFVVLLRQRKVKCADRAETVEVLFPVQTIVREERSEEERYIGKIGGCKAGLLRDGESVNLVQDSSVVTLEHSRWTIWSHSLGWLPHRGLAKRKSNVFLAGWVAQHAPSRASALTGGYCHRHRGEWG
jgi:hypothetical protein